MGCDVITEIQPISAAVINVIQQFERNAGALPGSLRLGLVRYGLERNIKIDLTLLDDINEFTNVINGVLIANIEDMKPITNAHPIPALQERIHIHDLTLGRPHRTNFDVWKLILKSKLYNFSKIMKSIEIRPLKNHARTSGSGISPMVTFNAQESFSSRFRVCPVQEYLIIGL